MHRPIIKPSRWYYGLAVFIFVIGVSTFVLFLFENLKGLTNSLWQVAVPGTYDMTLSDLGKYTIFYEYQSVFDGRIYSTRPNLSGLQCSLVSNETGAPMRLYKTSTNTTYSLGSRAGASVLNFNIDQPGSYAFSAWYPEGQEGPEVVLAIGYGFPQRLVKAVLGALGILFSTIGVTILIAVITLLKRRKARKRLEGKYPPPLSAPIG